MHDHVRVFLRVPGTAPMPEILDLVRSIEAAGFDGAGILDSQLLARDTFVTLALAARATSRMELFPAVSNPFTRHVSVLAGAIQTVEELAPGRIKLMLGTGFTSASTIGRKPATLGEMRACVKDVKALLAGESIDFGGKRGRLAYAAGRRIPVIVAASRPKALELAAEIADGVLALVGVHRRIIEAAIGHMERGAKRGGRRLEDLDIIWAVPTRVAATTAEARRLARPIAVDWGFLGVGGPWPEIAGVRVPRLEIPQAVREIYPDLSHGADWEASIAATSFVPDDVIAEICDALGLIGTPEDCAARIADLATIGVRGIYLMPFQTFAPPTAEIAAFRDVVFDRLRCAGLRSR